MNNDTSNTKTHSYTSSKLLSMRSFLSSRDILIATWFGIWCHHRVFLRTRHDKISKIDVKTRNHKSHKLLNGFCGNKPFFKHSCGITLKLSSGLHLFTISTICSRLLKSAIFDSSMHLSDQLISQNTFVSRFLKRLLPRPPLHCSWKLSWGLAQFAIL